MGHRLFVSMPDLLVAMHKALEHAECHTKQMENICKTLNNMIGGGCSHLQPEYQAAQTALTGAKQACEQIRLALETVLNSGRAYEKYLEVEATTQAASKPTPSPEPRL